MDSSRADGPLVCLCTFPVRADFDCIGPFLDEMSTDCGFWEDGRALAKAPAPASRALPATV